MLLAIYQGISIGSTGIRIVTRSDRTHVSKVFEDGVEFEAWSKAEHPQWYKPFAGYYQAVPFGENHRKGTVVELFSVPSLTKKAEKIIRLQSQLWADQQIPYDYPGCISFVTKRNSGDNTKLFCSEEVQESFSLAGHPLLVRTPSWKVAPKDIYRCDKLKLVKTLQIGEKFSIQQIVKKYQNFST